MMSARLLAATLRRRDRTPRGSRRGPGAPDFGGSFFVPSCLSAVALVASSGRERTARLRRVAYARSGEVGPRRRARAVPLRATPRDGARAGAIVARKLAPVQAISTPHDRERRLTSVALARRSGCLVLRGWLVTL
mmetsp:Transcript_18809/g.58739  ORF Transcript_18809/g.58739 Transcript_18809/m.58739 type:complete len:135 (+) Transcript_18809:363-767(+)